MRIAGRGAEPGNILYNNPEMLLRPTLVLNILVS